MEHTIYVLNTNTVLVNNSQMPLNRVSFRSCWFLSQPRNYPHFYGTRSVFPRLEDLSLALILNQMHPICIFPFRNEFFLRLLFSVICGNATFYPENGGRIKRRNVVNQLPVYTALSYFRRQQCDARNYSHDESKSCNTIWYRGCQNTTVTRPTEV